MGLPLAISDLKVFGDRGRTLLDVPVLSLGAGECLGVRGPSGAGKSTLLYALAGLARSASGRVDWGGTDVVALSAGRRARFRRENVGFVFQDFLLFEELGAVANAAVHAAFAGGRRRALSEKARRELQNLSVPVDGGRRAQTYSGGERQRISLARALANDPGVILADEPTASLDKETKDRLVDDLVRLVREKGKTLVAVSHDRELIARMDRTITIENGQVVPE
jgi:putative ABC transport system ATP-binding protein